VAWVDKAGRMWKLEAPGQGLRVERGPDILPKGAAPASAKPAASKPVPKPKSAH